MLMTTLMNKTMKLMMAVAVCALATGRSSAAVRTWPQPREMARSADFALTAGGQSVDVLATAKPQKRENRWRTRVYLKCRGEYLALALPFDCASLTTVVIDP